MKKPRKPKLPKSRTVDALEKYIKSSAYRNYQKKLCEYKAWQKKKKDAREKKRRERDALRKKKEMLLKKIRDGKC